MNNRFIKTVPLCLLSCLIALSGVLAQDIPVYGYTVVNTYPHDPNAFTQGLFFRDDTLYESTGQRGQSTIRKVALETGEVLQRQNFPAGVFGEGIIDWEDKLIGLSWKRQTGYVWNIDSFRMKRKFGYPGEGWGLTKNDTHLIMSDGTPTLKFLNPETYKEAHSIFVTANGQPVRNLNELEWVTTGGKSEIFANVWQTDAIARIDPETGNVTGWIDMRGLLAKAGSITGRPDVLNGIAVNSEGRLFVTGKNWAHLFEIELTQRR
ncbi:glutaminyl-peptide cyclotransferase [Kordiimonas aquimaris]|uniref:glutaminyl-peptide cyclotransferase n=1 Tax=Kordiimonas aquimaris TaxID=707591 RepID=UPI0021CF11AE|nr:glutaminyl-peptide cyclotransferase [Kordiimonas aquimaris]